MGVYTSKENEYPKLLREIGKDAPKQLYYKGNYDSEIFENCLAVVGSRSMTTYGKQVVDKIVGEVAAAGVTIVSGFMYGIDASSHKTALKVGGRTIAVMPCGIDLIHPEYQQNLYVEILENKGLIISEYEGNFQPALWTYPRRNRIVAGLAKATLIIEAGEKSGSLITADFAKKFGRKVFAVPGPITSENSKGIMQLLKNGAEMVESAGDILKFFGLSKPGFDSEKPGFKNPGLEGKIVEKLRLEPMNVDELARTFSMSASKLGVILSMMQLKGFIKQEGNKYHAAN